MNMKREELFSRLEQSMLVIGKEIYHEQISISNCSPAQNHVLMLVGISKSIGVKHLAEKLRVTSGAATQHIDALEKAGLLTRTINKSNRREVVVETTKKGKAIFEKIRRNKSALLSKLFEDLSDNELSTLVKLIEKVSKKYEK